jgi:hypothetical protein
MAEDGVEAAQRVDARALEGTNEGTAATRRAQFVLRIGLDETWYRIPDFW